MLNLPLLLLLLRILYTSLYRGRFLQPGTQSPEGHVLGICITITTSTTTTEVEVITIMYITS